MLSLVTHKNVGGYGLPGGKAMSGETPRQCAIRECREETGILATKTTLVYRATCEGFDCWTFFAREWHGRLRSSAEGTPRWVEPQMLLLGRYKEYNRGVLHNLAGELFGLAMAQDSLRVMVRDSLRRTRN